MKESRKVLVVDDVPANRMLISTVFCQLGIDCIEANNGKEAIEFVKNNEIDLIFMDIEMPEMNGIDATKYIRNNLNKTVPILAVTSYFKLFDENKELDHREVGFTEFLRKPISVHKIKELALKYLYEIETIVENYL